MIDLLLLLQLLHVLLLDLLLWLCSTLSCISGSVKLLLHLLLLLLAVQLLWLRV